MGIAVSVAVGVMVIGVWRTAKVLNKLVRGPQVRARRRLVGGSSAIEDHAVVTLTGRARAPAAALIAPLSGRSCVAYHIQAEIYEGTVGSRTRTQLVTIIEQRITPFELIVDGTTVLVDGETADVAARPVPIVPRKIELERDFVARHGHAMELARHSGFEEAILVAGDRIRVHGVALVDLDGPGERGYRDGPRRIRIVAHAGHPLTIDRAA